MRYDGNTDPHHHFVCERCGAIQDVDLALPEELHQRLRRKYRLSADRARIDFYGLCSGCSDPPDSKPE
jgi:Fe2+ or Zn2+ uptake regulation protein